MIPQLMKDENELTSVYPLGYLRGCVKKDSSRAVEVSMCITKAAAAYAGLKHV